MGKSRLEKSLTISPVGIRWSRVEEAWDEEWSYNEHGEKEAFGLRGCKGTGVGLWLGRRRFLHPTIPSACKAHACFVGVARCSFLGPNTALVVGSVQLPASVGNDIIQSFRYARNSGRIFHTS